MYNENKNTDFMYCCCIAFFDEGSMKHNEAYQRPN